MKWNVFSVSVLCLVLAILTNGCSSSQTKFTDLKTEHGAAIMRITNNGHGCTAWSTRLPTTGERVTVTNSHCAEMADKESGAVTAILSDGSRERIRLLYNSPYTDIAVFSGAHLATQDLELGELIDADKPLYTLGHPGMRALTLTEGWLLDRTVIQFPSFTTPEEECTLPKESMQRVFLGIFGEVPLCVTSIGALETDMKYYPGNSGSPVFQDGKVVGIAFASNGDASAGYFVSLSWLKYSLLLVEANQAIKALHENTQRQLEKQGPNL